MIVLQDSGGNILTVIFFMYPFSDITVLTVIHVVTLHYFITLYTYIIIHLIISLIFT